MRKTRYSATKLAALLAVTAGTAATASAQSSVTLYGVADVGVEYLSNAPAASGSGNVYRLSSGNMSTSRWGMRGTEDLGRGLKAVFDLESGFNLDEGAQSGNRLFDRGAFVGLAGDFGQITLGRQTTPLYDTTIRLDPMGFAPRYSLFRSDAVLAGRADNAIKYRHSFAGLTVAALYSFGRTGTGEIPGDSKVDRSFGASLYYENEAFAGGLVYDEYQGTSVAARNRKDRRVAAGASYAFGPVTPYIGYRWLNGDVSGDVRSNLYWVGLRYKATPALSLSGAAYYTDFRNSNADPMMFAASADYAFSRRTDVYINAGYARNRNGSGLGLNGLNPATGAPTSVIPGKNQTGVVAGIRHRF
ncbi:porin [Cupriavidus sp. 2TAF22]|uniref:porin n=1 Tax=unclassified Cupriavidus TaxID=2640874 RepID=UPI003F923921